MHRIRETLDPFCKELQKKYKLHKYFGRDIYSESHPHFNLAYDTIKKLPKDVEILDVGCGIGLLGLYLHLNGYSNYIGIDLDPQKVMAARDLFKEYDVPGHLMVEDLHTTPYAERYDVVTILGVTIEKDVDIDRILTGYNGDAMAMGGLMIIDIPHEYHPSHQQILSFQETVRKVTQLYSIEKVYPYAYHRRMWILRYRGEL